MTSSLVGSEMCIRDRRQPMSAVLYAQYHVRKCELGELLQVMHTWKFQFCLLYTSDAADDM
eukprot:6184459-Prorocentrum_lima.AAC.1